MFVDLPFSLLLVLLLPSILSVALPTTSASHPNHFVDIVSSPASQTFYLHRVSHLAMTRSHKL